jgi:hypothetical protein
MNKATTPIRKLDIAALIDEFKNGHNQRCSVEPTDKGGAPVGHA